MYVMYMELFKTHYYIIIRFKILVIQSKGGSYAYDGYDGLHEWLAM